MKKAFHLQLSSDDVAGCEIAFLPGDPDRVAKFEEHLDACTPLARAREFCSLRGSYRGREVLVVSTGIGGPSATLCLEELAMLGIKTFIRVGTTGAIAPHIDVGDMIIPTACVRYEGASQNFAPLAYPAVADFGLVQQLKNASLQYGQTHHLGVTCTTDTFYTGQNRQDTFADGFVCREVAGRLAELSHLNVLSFDMENASLLVQAQSYGLRCAAILGVLINRNSAQEIPDASVIAAIEKRVVQIALTAPFDY